MTDTDAHKTKMQKVQAEHRDKVSKLQDPGRGLILVHTGKEDHSKLHCLSGNEIVEKCAPF